jgi:hypothetical protein
MALAHARLLLITGLGLQALSPSAQATPDLVLLLLRHGHKSGDPNNHILSSQGLDRDEALATLIPSCCGRPSHTITLEVDPGRARMPAVIQTAMPLGDRA